MIVDENPLFLDNEQNKMLELIKEKGIKINEDPWLYDYKWNQYQ